MKTLLALALATITARSVAAKEVLPDARALLALEAQVFVANTRPVQQPQRFYDRTKFESLSIEEERQVFEAGAALTMARYLQGGPPAGATREEYARMIRAAVDRLTRFSPPLPAAEQERRKAKAVQTYIGLPQSQTTDAAADALARAAAGLPPRVDASKVTGAVERIVRPFQTRAPGPLESPSVPARPAAPARRAPPASAEPPPRLRKPLAPPPPPGARLANRVDKTDPAQRTPALFTAFKARFSEDERALFGAAGTRLVSREEWNAAAPAAPAPELRPRRIVVHHTGVAAHLTLDEGRAAEHVRAVQSYHMVGFQWRGKPRPMSDVGYHFLISANGVVYEGRWLGQQGTHAGRRADADSIAVALLGDFETRQPTPAQLAALTRLSAVLAREHGFSGNEAFSSHQEIYRGTQCPGRLLELALNGVWREARRALAPARPGS